MTTREHPKKPPRARRSRGSALPAILALSIGVAALAAGFTAQNHREHQREQYERNRAQAYLDAWAQMEVVTDVINTSPYDAGTGENLALSEAAARPDRMFVDRDGYPTGVVCEPDGGTGSGFFRLVSTRQIGDSRCRITALVRSRQSFADFDYFVNSHDLGISGGTDASSAHTDAPNGDIHSNRHLIFYFPDRHFVKAVTAHEGFQFVAGAVGPMDPSGNPQNNWMWGPSNDAANAVVGLTSVVPADIGQRTDTILNLDGAYDWAKVKLKGAQVYVEQWQYAHYEDRPVTTQVELFHYETQQQEVLKKVSTTTQVTVPVYTTVTTQVYGPVATQQLVTAAWDETVMQTQNQTQQVWHEGGGGGATGGGGAGTGDVGWWETVTVQVQVPVVVHHAAVYTTVYVDQWYTVTSQVQTGTTTQNQTVTSWVSYSPPQYKDVQVKVHDGWTTETSIQSVYVSQQRVGTYNVPATGTIYVTGKVEMMTMSKGSDGFDVHTLDGSLTISSGDYIYIRDSIVYAHPDAASKWQTAYLNGSDYTKEFTANPAYTGSSVLGLIAANDIEIWSNVPDQAEIDGTLMARDGEVRVRGVNVGSDGTVTAVSSGAYVHKSLRRLGGIISNQRPVTTYVDGNNAVTRGFIYTKSVYDVRQRTNPPRGFPTLDRPTILATLIREIN